MVENKIPVSSELLKTTKDLQLESLSKYFGIDLKGPRFTYSAKLNRIKRAFYGDQLAEFNPRLNSLVVRPHPPEENWQETLAHELGHSIHREISKKRKLGSERMSHEVAAESFAEFIRIIILFNADDQKILAHFKSVATNDLRVLYSSTQFARYPKAKDSQMNAAYYYYIFKSAGLDELLKFINATWKLSMVDFSLIGPDTTLSNSVFGQSVRKSKLFNNVIESICRQFGFGNCRILRQTTIDWYSSR